MPQKNTLKEYSSDSYYHIYARGVNKQKIFLEDEDYKYFLKLFHRYLSGEKVLNTTGGLYPDYSNDIDLISYCLMPNHFHLFVHQNEAEFGITKLMSGIMTSYSKYFNKKYKRVGSLFESRYKGKRITNDAYYSHISRYIHMNPRNWKAYKYSSLDYIFSIDRPSWLKPQILLEEFKTHQDYERFLEEYKDQKKMIEIIKNELADK